MSIKDISENKINVVSYWAKKWRTTIILKGANSIIASKNGDIYINSTGNDGMATAGSGDVLTGIISAFLSQKISGIDSAILGVYIHGLAGDLAAKDLGKVSLIATDIIKYLPSAFMSF
jgi:NAD(P)H-hydrate epimerase